MSQYKFVRYQQTTDLPFLNIRRIGVQPPHPPPDSSSNNCQVVSCISRSYWNIQSSFPPLNIKGVGAYFPPDRKTKPFGTLLDWEYITAFQKSKHLPPLNQRGVGLVWPHSTDRSLVRDPDGRNTIFDVLKEYENIIGAKQAAHLPPLNHIGAGVQHPDLPHKRCKVLPAITKGCKNIPGPQSEDFPSLTIRGVGIHPSSGVTPQMKPEENSVLPATSAMMEWGQVRRYQQYRFFPPNILIAGLRRKPQQKKIQLWKPDNETFAFICKRMKEDEWMDHAYQNSLSVADQETFSSKCKKLREMEDMMYILWRRDIEGNIRYTHF